MSDILTGSAPYLIMLAASVTGLFESALIKAYNKKYQGGGFIFTALVSFASALFFFIKYLFMDAEKGDFTPEVIPYAICAGLFYCSASVLTYYAIQYGSFAISMLILSYNIVIISGYGIIFLGETATVITYISFALIAFSLFLVRGKDDGEKKKFSFKWLVCIGLSVLLSGLFSVVLRMQQVKFSHTQDNECMIIALGISAIIMMIIGFVKAKSGGIKIITTAAPYALLAGAGNGLNNMLGLLLNNFIEISISAPTRSIMKTALTFMYSFILLKERFLPRQIVGIIIGALAVVMLNLPKELFAF